MQEYHQTYLLNFCNYPVYFSCISSACNHISTGQFIIIWRCSWWGNKLLEVIWDVKLKILNIVFFIWGQEHANFTQFMIIFLLLWWQFRPQTIVRITKKCAQTLNLTRTIFSEQQASAEIHGLIHFRRSEWRHVQSVGLQSEYTQNSIRSSHQITAGIGVFCHSKNWLLHHSGWRMTKTSFRLKIFWHIAKVNTLEWWEDLRNREKNLCIASNYGTNFI